MRNPGRYPKNWKDISKQARELAGNRCQGSPAFPLCRAENGQPHPVTGSRVILTVAHIGATKPDGSPGDPTDKFDVRPENLRVWCQRCHLTYDRPEHAAARKKKR